MRLLIGADAIRAGSREVALLPFDTKRGYVASAETLLG
jgi:hypothetical protein